MQFYDAGHPYRAIRDRTGVSVAAIGRLERVLEAGHGGDRTVLTASCGARNHERSDADQDRDPEIRETVREVVDRDVTHACAGPLDTAFAMPERVIEAR
ncbi:MAG: hypothetical protein ACNS61_03800 [Candidatus Wenzhouxiangella sp. M2_3B_020]